MEGGDLRVVALKVRKVEVIRQRLLAPVEPHRLEQSLTTTLIEIFYSYTAFMQRTAISKCYQRHEITVVSRPPPLRFPYNVPHLNYLSALPSYEGRAAVEGVKYSVSVSGHHNVKKGAVYCTLHEITGRRGGGCGSR
jgi:hypothetical protein